MTQVFCNKLRNNAFYYRVGIVNSNDYSPFGVQLDGRTITSDRYRYGFNGMEKDDEVKGKGNSYDFGARMLDPRVGRWLSGDPLENKYPSLSTYNFVSNSPIQFIDPDGKRIYFVPGAGNDESGWNYIDRFVSIFLSEEAFKICPLEVTYGKVGDMLFTTLYRESAWTEVTVKVQKPGYNNTLQESITTETQNQRVAMYETKIKDAVAEIVKDLNDNPLKSGETLDLMGYSYGSVAQAHIALALADLGYTVDNLVLVGSPIPEDSELYKALVDNENIKEVIRYDIEGDKLSNPKSVSEYLEGAVQNSTDDGPHFDLARPGKEADEEIKKLANFLGTSGISVDTGVVEDIKAKKNE